MKFKIKHETVGRIRVHLHQKRMSCLQADVFQYYLDSQDCVLTAKIYERTQDAVICYQGDREQVISILKKFHYEDIQVPDDILKNSGRELNGEYWEKLVEKVVLHYGCRWFLPSSFRALIISMKSIKYIRHGLQTLLQGKIEVPVLDGTAVGISVFRGDFATAGSIMFLLGIGETLEEWTHKKSVGDLARSMSLNVSKVWLVQDSQQILVPVSEIQAGDHIVVRMGNVIPFDGIVIAGEASVNQSSLTGESVPVRKCRDRYAYAGTVIEEGELTIQVKENNGSSKFEKIVTMIEESEKLKSSLESKALHLADQLVSYTLAGSALTYLVTRNTTKALSVLMVDFSCALKLAMPIAVLSAIREAGSHNITVKG
ncbi:MAG: HAD-IC family P-type ATPase, partial [Lachnospiraceae bacterium]|nr:HAD-IC family P-type ATPase [Lachnospiraceae bacterium]